MGQRIAPASAQSLEARLEALGFDGIDANFRCIMALAPAPAAAYARILAELSGAQGSAKSLALRGKVLSNMGRDAEALKDLEKAVSLDASLACARVWLGEALLLSGDFERAKAQLDRAIALDPKSTWAAFFRAACRVGLGEADAARQELGKIDGAARPAAQALAALLEAQEGRWKEALSAWGRVIAACPGQAWPLVLRARSHKKNEDLTNCLRDLRAALASQPAGWIFMERSRVYEEMGDLERAVCDVDEALKLDGPQEDYFQRRAHLQICRRHYHLAVPDYTEMLKLRPDNARALLARAMVYSIRNDMDACLADVDAARKAAPGDPEVELERLRFSIYAGRVKTVARDCAALEKRLPELKSAVQFVRGCHRLKTREYAASSAEFAKGMTSGGDTDFDKKLAFHRVIAEALAARERPPDFAPVKKGLARLYICGLGIYPPYTSSLETLRAIASCDMVFNNLSEPEIASMLWLLCSDCEPTMYDIRGADARWTNTIFRQITAGRTVGFVTRGHPLVCGGLARSLIGECRRRGDVEYRVFGSVSSVNTLAAQALPPSAENFWGLQVLDFSSVFSPNFTVDTRVPVVLYFNSTAMILEKKEHERFCDVLEKVYAADHHVLFYGRTFNMTPDRIPLSALRAYHRRIDPSYTLLIPAKAAA